MTLWAVGVRVAAGRRDALAEWLVGRTGQAVEERADGRVIAYAEEGAADTLIAALHAREGADIELERSMVAPVDWVSRWREGIGARSVGRILLHPSWIDVVPAAGQVALTLDPETAFGSGEHGSTR
ncbi:MAG: 50S ribosomal protein L11 methyltransferase, partial [Gemmatimonadales bacterium]